MLVNLDENFLSHNDQFFKTTFQLLGTYEVETKNDFKELFEAYVQMDSLIETYSDLALELADFSDELEALENKLCKLAEKFDFSDHESSKIQNYIDLTREGDDSRRQLFKAYEDSFDRFDFSFKRSLEEYYQTRKFDAFSELKKIAHDKRHSNTMMDILRGRSKVYNAEILEKAFKKLKGLKNEDFLPSQELPPLKSYMELIDDVLNIFSQQFEVSIKREGGFLYIDDKGFIYLDPFSRDGKFDRPWTQVIQAGDKKEKKGICVVGFSFSQNITPTDLRAIFHELGHAFHHILNAHTDFFQSGMNSLSPSELEYPSIYMERYLMDRNQFLNLWDSESAYEYAVDHYMVLLNKTIFLTVLDQLIHREKYDSIEELYEKVNNQLKELDLQVPYICAECAAIFGHAFEDDMYAGKYYWYLQADLWYEGLADKTKNPFI